MSQKCARLHRVLPNIPRFTIEGEQDCPFCGGTVGFNTTLGLVVHSVPTCTHYDKAEDSLEFVRACNKKLGLKP